MAPNIYQIAFASLRGINRTLAEELLTRIESEERFFTLSHRDLIDTIGFDNKLFDRKYRDEILAKASIETEFLNKHPNIRAIYFTDEAFPRRFADCEDAPIMLYMAGECDLNAAHIVSVVGTRHATPYGNSFVSSLVEDLASSMENIVIVSGLAYGIDITAHRAALRAGIPTIAVLAHGLNTIYPATHRNTAVEMVQNGGGLITDYRSSDAIHRGNFIARNRIVAAMSDCTIVAESAKKGGALITARLASGYCRDVFALPGRTSDPYSAGCNHLIATNTAALITNADDLITAMRWAPRKKEGEQTEMILELTDEEQSVVEYLTQHGEAQINTLCVSVNIPIARLMGILIDMEFKGLILSFPGSKYRLA